IKAFVNVGVESFGEGTEVLAKRNPPPQRGNGERGYPLSLLSFFRDLNHQLVNLLLHFGPELLLVNPKHFRLATLTPHDEVLATVGLLTQNGDAGAPQSLGRFLFLGECCFAK
ncbi:hypothetical protein MAH48_15345, partial [Anoxybacillus flavithermus]|nr:hypothetical protein [Anoxybacillus flavithermus]